MVSGSPLTWWSRLPSRAPLVMLTIPDCTLWLGALGRQELLAEFCAGAARLVSMLHACKGLAMHAGQLLGCSVRLRWHHLPIANKTAGKMVTAWQVSVSHSACPLTSILCPVPIYVAHHATSRIGSCQRNLLAGSSANSLCGPGQHRPSHGR